MPHSSATLAKLICDCVDKYLVESIISGSKQMKKDLLGPESYEDTRAGKRCFDRR